MFKFVSETAFNVVRAGTSVQPSERVLKVLNGVCSLSLSVAASVRRRPSHTNAGLFVAVD